MKDAKRRTIMVLLFCFCVGIAMAQQKRTISGTVTDTKGLPVPGATIQIKGTANGGATDLNGKFRVSFDNPDAILVVSSVNHKSQEVKIGKSDELDVVLETDEAGLEDVVVTALGIKREKRALGYATATVKGDDLLKAGATQNPFLALYGKAAGVGINISSAGPTGGVNVRIRGAAGLESTTNTRPLFVVDGVPLYDEKTSMESRGYDPLNSFDYGSGVNDINSDDIESIEVLKGAKATVLYGSQALNGVVLITTKSGKKTRGLGIQLSHQVTVDKPFTFIDFQNDFGSGASTRDTQYVTIGGVKTRKLPLSRLNFGPRFDNSSVMLYDSTMGTYKAYPDNFIDFFSNALSNRTNIAVSGGGSMGSVRASYTRNTYEDVIPGFTQKQNTFSFNGNFKVSEFATFEFVNNLYSVQTTNRRPNIQQWVASGLNRDYDYNSMKSFYHDRDGFRRDLEPYGLNASDPGYWPNAVGGILWEQNDNKDQDNKVHLVSSVRSTLQFTKNISLLAQASLDYTNTDFITENKIIRLAPTRMGGKYSWTKRNTTVQNFQALMKYEKTFGDFNFFGLGGGAYQKVAENNMYASTGEMGLIYPDWFSLGNADTRWWPTAGNRDKVSGLKRGSDRLYSLLGSATLSWKETYYLEVQARNDWNSSLQAPNYSYFYPGVSLSYNFDRDFEIPQLQYGKLRLAWADVGGGPTTAVGDRYFANDAYTVSQIPYTSGPTSVAPPDALFLEPLKPFRKREFEVGFNTRWFERSRLEFDFSFYTNNTYNMIVKQPISPATGYNAAKINTGNVKNWGLEIMLKGAPLVTKNYRWDLTFTAANQFSKVVKLYPGITQKAIEGSIPGFQVWAKEGERIGEIRAYDYKRDPGGNRIVAANGMYALTDKITGTGKNVNPKVFGGLYSDFSFKGFNFHFGIDYKFGGTIFSYTNNYLMGTGVSKASLHGRDEATGGLAYYIDNATGAKVSWEHNKQAPAAARGGIVYHDGMVLDGVKEVNTGGTVKYEKNDVIVAAPDYYLTYINDNSTSWPPDRLFKNDYIKLREISVAYALPAKISNMLKLQKLSLTAAVRNLGYLYKTVPNIDPESALGAQGYIENSFYPSIRSFIFGVNVSF
jgi:TonB-linked SusC/RagA family outer membrane protein